MRFARLAAVGLLAIVASCGGSSPTGNSNNQPVDPPPPTGGKNVTIQDFAFSPETVTVAVGSSVQWVNHGPSAHHVVSDDGMWDSGQLSGGSADSSYYGGGSASGDSYTFHFDSAGTYNYHCANHPPSAYPNFVGVVIVTP
jgi:plastocyanin